MTLESGTRLRSYVIDALLGAGAMGFVYRAHDQTLQRDVAIKVLAGFVSAASVDRILREARAISALNRPNICTIHEGWGGRRRSDARFAALVRRVNLRR